MVVSYVHVVAGVDQFSFEFHSKLFYSLVLIYVMFSVGKINIFNTAYQLLEKKDYLFQIYGF